MVVAMTFNIAHIIKPLKNRVCALAAILIGSRWPGLVEQSGGRGTKER